MPAPSRDPAALLVEWRTGNRAALDDLFPLVYDELRERARYYLRHQSEVRTLTTTALVHETYLKLIGADRLPVEDRAHFLALAARAMRHVLIDYARSARTEKRGGTEGTIQLQLDDPPVLTDTGADQLLALHEALERLASVSERMARIVELRYFGGLTIEEIATALGVAPSTVKLDWQKARAWLYRELQES
jgi:RNA polymerase sigma factor (TIGR02999 family)